MSRLQNSAVLRGDGYDNPLVTRLRLVTHLNETDIIRFVELTGEPRPLRARAEFVREGERSDQLHVLLDGWACRYQLLADGRRQITALFLPGDICDLDVLYAERGRTTLATLTSCSIAALPRAPLARLAAERQGIAAALGRLAAIEQAKLAERNTCLGRRSAREQLAHLLCELLVRLTLVGRSHGGHAFDLPITQEEIADVLGLTSVHVNRVLQTLRSDRLIEQGGHAVTIRDYVTLRKIGGFRPDYLTLMRPEQPVPAWLASLDDKPPSIGTFNG